jgi:hypothetical protein
MVRGISKTAGKKTAVVRCNDKTIRLVGEAIVPPPPVVLDGLWKFELKPTLDNRWGDFRLPASNTFIGPEARRFLYADEVSPDPGWQAPDVDDSQWTKTTYSLGQRFWRLGPLPAGINTTRLDSELSSLDCIDPKVPVEVEGKAFYWQPYAYSLREGVEGDPGHEGYHGLKENVSDDFIALGSKRETPTNTFYTSDSPDEGCYYLWTGILSAKNVQAVVHVGEMKPAVVWISGNRLANFTDTLPIKAGSTPLLLRYDGAGRGHFVLEDADAPKDTPKYPLAMGWYGNSGVLLYDPAPERERPVGWYRFTAPPGLRSMKLVVHGRVRAWADGEEMAVVQTNEGDDGSRGYEATVLQPCPDMTKVAIRLEQDRGYYGGAAIPEPISLECVSGRMPLGDWSNPCVLSSYSGGAWYRRTVTLDAERTKGRIILHLGGVASSAEVHINGRLADILVSPPWQVDISTLVKPGDNRIEILVYNTLANHYSTIPTRYRGSPTSGLLGPVIIETAVPVTLKESVQ